VAEAEPRPSPVAEAAAAVQDAPRPSVGRVVLYQPTPAERIGRGGGEFWPAVVTRVWSPTVVNLHVLPDGDRVFYVTSVERARDGADAPRSWRWPPRA
jgi:hypothetical protein